MANNMATQLATEDQVAGQLSETAKVLVWIRNLHGLYTELHNELELFNISSKSHVVCHFYHNSIDQCRAIDMHLKILAARHLQTKFCKINAEKPSYLLGRMKVGKMAAICVMRNNRIQDFITNFWGLKAGDDFSTDVLEWRIALTGAIAYEGDLNTPPDQTNYTNGYEADKSDNDSDSDNEPN